MKTLLNISRAFVYELVESGEISHVRVGNAICFTEEHVQEYVARREQKAGRTPKSSPPKHQRATPKRRPNLQHIELG